MKRLILSSKGKERKKEDEGNGGLGEGVERGEDGLYMFRKRIKNAEVVVVLGCPRST